MIFVEVITELQVQEPVLRWREFGGGLSTEVDGATLLLFPPAGSSRWVLRTEILRGHPSIEVEHAFPARPTDAECLAALGLVRRALAVVAS